MKIKLFFRNVILCTSPFFVTSCKKIVEVPSPKTQLISKAIFNSDEASKSALLGLYTKMKNSSMDLSNGGVTIYAGLSSGELINSSPSSDFDAFFMNELNASNETGLFNRLWRPAYENIYMANVIIEGVESSKNLSIEHIASIKAECLAIRALYYFYLVNLFGSVPLVIHTDYLTNENLPNSAPEHVSTQIVNDLEDANILFSNIHPDQSNIRVSRAAAIALLSRVYLFQKKWKEAAQYSTEIIEKHNYHLETPEKVFKKESKETIWSIESSQSSGYNTAEGILFVPYSSSAIPQFAIAQAIIKKFDDYDLRFKNWVGMNEIDGEKLYFPYKYKTGFSSVLDEHYVILRLSEQYLIRAEALAQTGYLTESLKDLNIIRNRSGLEPINTINREDLLEAIYAEREREFFCEWGNRWLDMIRTGRADEILAIEKYPNWQTTDKLYPIPLSQIRLNTSLTQNPGY